MPDRPPLHRRWHPPKQERRGNSAERGYGAAWKRLRAAHLAEHPVCAECERHGMTVKAVAVDHIIPHCGDPGLLYDPSNLQSLCPTCHGRKSATYDGAFGNERKPLPGPGAQ